MYNFEKENLSPAIQDWPGDDWKEEKLNSSLGLIGNVVWCIDFRSENWDAF